MNEYEWNLGESKGVILRTMAMKQEISMIDWEILV